MLYIKQFNYIAVMLVLLLVFLFIYRTWMVDTDASYGLLGNLNMNNVVSFRTEDKERMLKLEN